MLDKLNLQLFTEGEPVEEGVEPGSKTGAEPNNNTEPSIEEIIEQEKKKWKEEWDKKLQSETDRRVNQARAKWEKELEEKERLAKLSEEEKIEELKRIKEEELAERERELKIKTVKLEILENLKEAGLLDAESIFKPENYIGEEGKEQLTEDIKALQEFIKKVVEKTTNQLREQILTSGEIPGKGNTGDINEYETAKKKGNLLEMLSAKLK